MDFELNDEQVMLRDTTRELLSRSYDAEKRGAVTAEGKGWSDEVWGTLAEIGVLGLPFAEADGGMGAGGTCSATGSGRGSGCGSGCGTGWGARSRGAATRQITVATAIRQPATRNPRA